MKVRQRLWWVLGGVFLVVCVGFVLTTYRFGWSATGFLNKSLWDWLQLLIVPLVLAVVALLFQLANSSTERQIALDKQREDLLQAYLDRMSELLLKEKLRSSAVDAEVRNVVRVRTITILSQLDARRIGYVFAFLREARLMSTTPNDSIVSLKNANLEKINFSQADLKEANLSGTDLKEANLSQAGLSEANLSGTDLSFVDLRGADLFKANLSKASLGEANLSKASLMVANLSGAFLRGANLKRANLYEANLSQADLSEANLSKASLGKADLSEAHLFKANFIKADLSGVDLSGQYLSGVNLRGANLSEANLSKAFLSEAKVTEEQLKNAESLQGATMPDGTKHP